MAQEHVCFGRVALTDDTPVEPHLIAGRDTRAERYQLAIDGEPAGADPFLRLAARADAEPCEHLLCTLGPGVALRTVSARSRARRRRARSRLAARRKALLLRRS